jgi:hypothetical protein
MVPVSPDCKKRWVSVSADISTQAGTLDALKNKYAYVVAQADARKALVEYQFGTNNYTVDQHRVSELGRQVHRPRGVRLHHLHGSDWVDIFASHYEVPAARPCSSNYVATFDGSAAGLTSIPQVTIFAPSPRDLRQRRRSRRQRRERSARAPASPAVSTSTTTA